MAQPMRRTSTNPASVTRPLPEQGHSAARAVAAAIAENRVTIAVQPVVNARKPDFVAFHEVLLRIKDGQGGYLMPGDFMPAVEHRELGRMLDRIVLRQALKQLASTPGIRLSVNLSANGVGDEDWFAILRTYCDASPGLTDFLIVEITETAVLEQTPDKINFLQRVRNLGCSIALDDFGAGNTSLNHLSRFRFDILKFDGGFMKDLTTNEDTQFLVRSMVAIARHFDMFTVMEYVENAEDAALLSDLGVDCLQGFAFGRPSVDLPWATQIPRGRLSGLSSKL